MNRFWACIFVSMLKLNLSTKAVVSGTQVQFCSCMFLCLGTSLLLAALIHTIICACVRWLEIFCQVTKLMQSVYMCAVTC